MPRVASLSDDIHTIASLNQTIDESPQCQRMGIMAAFKSMDCFKRLVDCMSISLIEQCVYFNIYNTFDYNNKICSVFMCNSDILFTELLNIFLFFSHFDSITERFSNPPGSPTLLDAGFRDFNSPPESKVRLK